MKREMEKHPLFVGREKELDDLLEFVHNAFEGTSGVGFITGEAGIGKTTLVQELIRRLRTETQNVVIASGECSIQSASYLPFQGILENLLESQKEVGLSEKRLKKVAEVVLDTIWNVGPDLIGVFGVPIKVLQSVVDKLGWRGKKSVATLEIPKDLDQHKIFGWYTKVMRDISTQFPLVLFIDDLQWADDSSINLLLHLGRELEQSRLVVLGTYRPHEVAQNGLLMQVKATLGRYGAREFSLNLAQNDERDLARTQQFVHDYLIAKYGTNFSDSFETILADRSEGNALFLTEMLLNMEEKGQIQPIPQAQAGENEIWQLTEQNISQDLPQKIEHAIQERVNRLETTLREVLEYASVEGDEFIAQVIARVRQIQERDLLNDLTRKLMKIYHLIYERGGKSLSNGSRVHEFAFKHNLIREYLYNNLSDTDKELIHADIGECLEQLYEPDNVEIAAKLAIHFSKGYIMDKAVKYCLLAAKNANRSYGASEAIHFGTMGLNAIKAQKGMLPETDYAEQKMQLLLELARAEEFGGNLKDDTDHMQAGIDYLESNFEQVSKCSKSLQAQVYIQLGKLCDLKGTKSQEALKYLEKARLLSEELNCHENLVNIFLLLSDLYHEVTDSAGNHFSVQESIKILLKALSITREIKDVQLEAMCLNRIAYRYCNPPADLKLAEKYNSQALERVESLEKSDRYLTTIKIKIFDIFGHIARREGSFKTAMKHSQAGLELATQVGDLLSQRSLLSNIGIYAGRYVHLMGYAEESFKNGLIIEEKLNYGKHSVLGGLIFLFFRRGDWQNAEMCLQRMQEIHQGKLAESYNHYCAATLNYYQENYLEAEKHIQIRINYLLQTDRPLPSLAFSRMTLASHYLGKKEIAKQRLEQTLTLFKQNDNQDTKWQTAYYIAEIYRVLGDCESAQSYCQEALDWYFANSEDPENLVFVAEARLVMGKVLVDMKDATNALLYLEKARNAFETCGYYALGEALFHEGKAHQKMGNFSETRRLVEKALSEFQRLKLTHSTATAMTFLERLKE